MSLLVKVLNFVLYAGAGIAISEAVYLLFVCLKKKEREQIDDEVSEVIWTNELTHECVEHHYSYRNGYSLSPKNDKQGTMINCNNAYCAYKNIGRIIRFIDSAKYSIDLAMYTFTSIEMSNALHRALRRDVIVRIITDREMAYSTGSQVTSLTKAGTPVRFPLSKSLMHHKFCIVDGVNRVPRIMLKDNKEFDSKKVQSLLMNGSLNWTTHGFNENWENILITSNKELVQKFEEEFERMWQKFENEPKKQ